MGRIIVGFFVVLALVPGFMLAKLWLGAANRRMIDFGSMSFVEPTKAAADSTAHFVRRRSRSTYCGVGVGVVICIVLAAKIGVSTVFFWIPILILGGLFGVLVGAALPQRVAWERVAGDRRVSLDALTWSMRGTCLVALGTAVVGYLDAGPQHLLTAGCAVDSKPGPSATLCLAAIGVSASAWLIGELAILRLAPGRKIPKDGADVAVDDAARSAIAHTAVGATTLLALISLSVVGIGAGLVAASGSCSASAAVGAVLLTLGLAAAIAAVVMAGTLIQWGSQLRKIATYVHKVVYQDVVTGGR